MSSEADKPLGINAGQEGSDAASETCLSVLEVDGRKMPERISAARDAIAGRLRAMEGDSDHHGERERIEDALRALNVLTTESQAWQ